MSLEEAAGYFHQMLLGAVVNLELFALSILLTMVAGTAIGIATVISRSWLVQGLWRVYASFVMGVPSLLIIFLIYYGGSITLEALWGRAWNFEITPFAAGVAALTFVYSAYVAELVRGARRNLPQGQLEACEALAIGPARAWGHVILPQMLRLALPGLVNLCVVVLKDTSLVSLAGLSDLVGKAKIAAGATKEPFGFFIGAALLFVLFTTSLLPLARRLEVHLGRGYAGSRS
jgi:His/Glu/Gln/Arg/opine family amino acid ABC transporter permease subunit